MTGLWRKQTESLLVEHCLQLPNAFSRLNRSIFCEERARKLRENEFEVIYTNNSLLKELGYIKNELQPEIDSLVGECFGYRLTTEEKYDRIVYADRQADPTDIALSGNEGSGRACYIGSDFNIKGIGRTQLCKNAINSIHGTGTLDVVTALREAITSNYIYEHTMMKTSPVIAVIALKERMKYGWCEKPLQNALLVRLDKGFLDRVSHASYVPLHREINLDMLIDRYALCDAEMFGHRIFHGAWSTGNSSLNGTWLDMESLSFVEGRGARWNITKKYISNYFGYENLGIKQVLDQVWNSVNGKNNRGEWENTFENLREKYLIKEMLRLLGVDRENIEQIIQTQPECYHLSRQFEQLAKKISPLKNNLNVFGQDFSGTHLLDFSHFFRTYPQLYQHNSSMHILKEVLQRNEEIEYCYTKIFTAENNAEKQLLDQAVVSIKNKKMFEQKVDEFLDGFLKFTNTLTRKGLLPNRVHWEENVEKENKELPNFEQLSGKIRECYTKYENEEISASQLNRKIKGLL